MKPCLGKCESVLCGCYDEDEEEVTTLHHAKCKCGECEAERGEWEYQKRRDEQAE